MPRLPGSESGACLVGAHSPRSLPFAPPTPQRIPPLCSSASQLLWQGQTSRVRSSSATVPHLPDAGRQRSGQTRDLPASDAIPLHVMWPSTPAGRQHLALRCRTCCLRANRNSRPLRYMIFRGSIPHPMQSLCTLRSRCRQGSRNTRYRAGAIPYLGRLSPAGSHQLAAGAPIRSPCRRAPLMLGGP